MWEPLEPSSHLQAELQASKLLVLTHPQKTSKSHVVARVETRWRSYRVKTSRWGQPEVPPARRSWFLFCVTICHLSIGLCVGYIRCRKSISLTWETLVKSDKAIFLLPFLPFGTDSAMHITQGYRFPLALWMAVSGAATLGAAPWLLSLGQRKFIARWGRQHSQTVSHWTGKISGDFWFECWYFAELRQARSFACWWPVSSFFF
jgi:hypothetical protein